MCRMRSKVREVRLKLKATFLQAHVNSRDATRRDLAGPCTHQDPTEKAPVRFKIVSDGRKEESYDTNDNEPRGRIAHSVRTEIPARSHRAPDHLTRAAE